jgi:hypothetical protein
MTPGTRGERVGVLVLRVWIDHEGADGFRARITSTHSLVGGRERVSVAAEPIAVLATVERWLAEYLGAATTSGREPQHLR